MKGYPKLASHEREYLRELAPALSASEVFILMDDFFHYDPTGTVGDYAVVADGAGAALVGDAAGGVLTLSTGAADNDEIYVSSMAEVFTFNTTKKVSFMAKFAFTEASVTAGNLAIGLSNTVAANSLVDNGGGMMANFNGAVFYKVDGTMTLYFKTSNGVTCNTAQAMCPFVSGRNYLVGFDYDFMDGVTARVYPWVHDLTTGAEYVGAYHDLTIATLDEMHVLMGVKNGGGVVQTMAVDFFKVWQER